MRFVSNEFRETAYYGLEEEEDDDDKQEGDDYDNHKQQAVGDLLTKGNPTTNHEMEWPQQPLMFESWAGGGGGGGNADSSIASQDVVGPVTITHSHHGGRREDTPEASLRNVLPGGVLTVPLVTSDPPRASAPFPSRPARTTHELMALFGAGPFSAAEDKDKEMIHPTGPLLLAVVEPAVGPTTTTVTPIQQPETDSSASQLQFHLPSPTSSASTTSDDED